MNLRQLKYFISVVNTGNMTRAAELGNVAQTALSAQIRQLEEDLGVALLVRHSRGVEATEAGRALYERGLAILKLVEDTRQEMATFAATDRERVRFGITPALMLIIGADLIECVAKDCPDLSFSIVEAMSHLLAPDVLSGALDYALCYDAPDQPQLRRTAFLQEDLVFVTRPGRGFGPTVRLGEVLTETLAMPDELDTVRLAVAAAARSLGSEVRVTHEVRSISAMKSLAIRGAASCVLPLAALSEEVAAGTLVAHPIVAPAVRRTLYLVTATQRPGFRCDPALAAAVGASLGGLFALLGSLAHPIAPASR
jgi:LysR family nitrogen assimilation transcriptional regulator